MRLGFKGVAGQAAYYLAGLEEVISGTRNMLSVEVDRKPYEVASVVVMNGRLYGGRFVCAPEANLREPVLYAVLMTRPGRINIVRYGLALIAGRLHRLPDVYVIPAREVRILAPAGEPCQSDGDLIGNTPIDVTIRQDALEILYPPDLRAL